MADVNSKFMCNVEELENIVDNYIIHLYILDKLQGTQR